MQEGCQSCMGVWHQGVGHERWGQRNGGARCIVATLVYARSCSLETSVWR